MADEKKISDLTTASSANDLDEFVVVNKAVTSGQDAAESGQTSKITFGDLKTAIGTQGPAGADGQNGADGATGPAGPKGDKGNAGNNGVAGPAGPKGTTGNAGAQGPKGDKGDKGNAGNSITGPAGPKGNTGTTGPTGPKGSTGPSGSPWGGGTFTGPVTLSQGVLGETHFGGNVNGRFDVTAENGQTTGTNNAAFRVASNLGGVQHIGAFQIQAIWPAVGMGHSHTNDQNATVHIQVTGTNTAMFWPSGHAHAYGAGITMGSGSKKWGQIYSNTNTISTSDVNAKTEIRDLNEAEKKVAEKLKSLVKIYKVKKAVSLKGDKARMHCGFIAQEVESAFESEGLNGFEYGIVGKDTWYEATETDEEGNLHTSDEPKDGYVEKTEYNVRYSELLAFIISAL